MADDITDVLGDLGDDDTDGLSLGSTDVGSDSNDQSLNDLTGDLASGGDSAAASTGSGSSITGAAAGSSSSPSSTNWGSVVTSIATGAENVAQSLGLSDLVDSVEQDAANASSGLSGLSSSAKTLEWILAGGLLAVVLAVAFL